MENVCIEAASLMSVGSLFHKIGALIARDWPLDSVLVLGTYSWSRCLVLLPVMSVTVVRFIICCGKNLFSCL